MLGAIIGDIAGSRFDGHRPPPAGFELITPQCHYTDDTLMTVAIGAAVTSGFRNICEEEEAVVRTMRRFAELYPLGGHLSGGYGERFAAWLESPDPQPYNSWGNGSAMRVSAVGWIFSTLETTQHQAEITAAVTHNHPEGIKGAQAVATAIFLASTGEQPTHIRSYLQHEYGYDLSRSFAEIEPYRRLDNSCQGTVPQAITAALEAASFEDAIRKAISLGGDMDTLAAMAGSIAAARFPIPAHLRRQALAKLDRHLVSEVEMFERHSARARTDPGRPV